MSCLTLLAGRAEACLVCIPFPEKTTTDQLLHADVVVLARENSERPFSYIAKKILKGDLDDAAIDLFVNSSTGQRLALYPDQSVVLTFNNTLLSALVLRERVGLHRWSAVVIGFGAVVFMLDPGSSLFRIESAMPLFSALCYALIPIINRHIGLSEHDDWRRGDCGQRLLHHPARAAAAWACCGGCGRYGGLAGLQFRGQYTQYGSVEFIHRPEVLTDEFQASRRPGPRPKPRLLSKLSPEYQIPRPSNSLLIPWLSSAAMPPYS